MSKLNAVITGVGGYVPDTIVTNEDICKLVESSDEWIVSRTGIKERRKLSENVGTSFMGSKAVQELLRKTGTDPLEIEAVICATNTPDHVLPAAATMIAEQCGLKKAFGYDIGAACSGFIFALSTGAAFIEAGRFKKVIVVASEKMTSITNYNDRTTCPLFGDGAGAVLLEPTTEDYGLMDSVMHSDGSGLPHLHMKAGGSVKPACHESVDNDEHYVYQEGQAVFKTAVNRLVEACEEIKERNNLKPEDVTWVVPHQANMRILDAIVRFMDIPIERVMINIQKYGNTSSASIPLCLWEYESQLKKGDVLILSAFGAGFSWGGLYLKWGYDPK
ncbi:MAG TPA: 3-oxoacyl-ACP synthase [Firmicutes bacterium]|jgi:3-oxoacyl-[acyl-carrier-protein] synthase III|nr:3-oxoacyl-ACP synthase [Bacillota bacterium]